MLVEDRLTGYLHEIPDHQMGQAPHIAVDGLGNPVGLFPGFAQLLQRFLPGASAAINPVGAAMQAAGAALPGALGRDIGRFFPPPGFPAGWMRPPLPYTGLGPRRLYMRCAVW